METKDIFKAVRSALNLDQEGIAVKLEMKQGSISDIERGRTGLSAKIKKRLIAMGVNKEFLESGEGEPLSSEPPIKEPITTAPALTNGIHEGKALHFYLKLKHGGISEFAKAMGFADTSYSYMYELFDEEKISDVNWGKFKEKAGLSKSDVMLKYQSMQSAVSPPNKGVPVYNVDFTAGDVTQFSEFQEQIMGYIDLNGFKKCVAFVPVKGNSMFPTFTAGDLIGLEPQENFKIIDYGLPYAVVTKTGQRLIKFIRRGKDNENLILRSNNKDYDDIDLHKEDILMLYKAHGPVRDSHY